MSDSAVEQLRRLGAVPFEELEREADEILLRVLRASSVERRVVEQWARIKGLS